MIPTRRAALLLGAIAVIAVAVPVAATVLMVIAWSVATVTDALLVRRPPSVERTTPRIVARGVSANLVVEADFPAASRVRVRQPVPPDVTIEPSEADSRLDATLVPRRRGRYRLPLVSVRSWGPLGLGAWDFDAGEPSELVVYPNVFAARQIATAVRRGRFGEHGQLPRGPLGLGTQFEQIREYQPDDDVRQVNWPVTARMGRPMSNQYRVDQDRDVMCVVDTGRLMTAPIEGRTRLDAAIDAAVAVAMVADVVGDRCGTIAFSDELHRQLSPRRAGADAVVRALFDVEPRSVDSDYELAFRSISTGKRAMIVVFTDLLDDAAARALTEAMPVLSRRHAVVIATATDPDLDSLVHAEPQTVFDAYSVAVASDVLRERARVASRLSATGAEIVEARADRLGAACVRAYLRAKSRGRL